MNIRNEIKSRVEAVAKELSMRRLDAFFVTNETNVSYLSGFEGHDSMLLITQSARFFITDSRYAEEAKAAVNEFGIEVVRSSTYETLEELKSENNLKRIGFESMDLPYEAAARLKAKTKGVELVPIAGLVEALRSIKSAPEVKLIKRSIRLAREVMTIVSRKVKPGATEKSLSDIIDIEFIKKGARSSFEPIVAAGKNSSRPHARPTGLKIPNNTFVMLDIGCSLDGYNSDITRMAALGKISAEFKNIYAVVKEAEERAIRKIRPGEKISSVDEAARGFIKDEGFEKFFGHALGHGVGMSVHEEPTISKKTEGALKTGMVFTIEPAVYIPDLGGVRIEDMVLVTKNGCEVLTR